MKKHLLIAAGVALVAMPLSAQKLREGYLVWPESSQLHTYIKAWNGGYGKLTIGGSEWEDENFFVSRVKPKERFYNQQTQVYPTITQWSTSNTNGNDKRLCYWVPIGESSRDGIQLNALPDGVFDGEVFNMWSYVDHWGNWNSPYGWVPGNFADVAHKNGVAVSGVASVPWQGIAGTWATCLDGVVACGNEAVAKWLYYHGVDGLGYNSEWSGWSPSGRGLIALHNYLYDYMRTQGRNPIFENLWYGITDDNGSYMNDVGLSRSTQLFRGSSIFLNYNWNVESYMSSSVSTAEGMGISPFYIYAGMNVQGGEPKRGVNYPLLKNYKYSIGLWGAHSVNMLWQTRYANGSSEQAKIRTYLKSVEQWFSNGPRNPAIKLELTHNQAHRPHDDWAGMSAMMSARSSLSWDLDKEPFYTFFNIGNGQFFNWKGVRQHNNSWHNIGVQDYQPTWHYWFAPKFLQQNVDKGTVSLAADVTWEDAYVGGSCLKLTGTATEEYLHLFKTHFPIKSGYELVVSYRLLDGEGNVGLALATDDAPTTIVAENNFRLFTTETSEDVADECFNGWKTVVLPLNDLNNKNLELIALKFTNVKNLNLLLGQLSIRPATPAAKPDKPEIKVAKQLAYNVAGVDAKLIWNMRNDKPVGDPCYNLDVKTSMFALWVRQQGQEPVMMGLTTSWAGFIFAAPVKPDGVQKMMFGVQALSLDTETGSDIAWTSYNTLDNYQTIDDITIDKNIIKPNQEFTVEFVDKLHEPVDWVITNSAGQQMFTANGIGFTYDGLKEIGGYTLKVGAKEYPYYISVSDEKVGALPEIKTLSIDEEPVAEDAETVEFKINDAHKFSYTGRNANGSASRGVDLNENWFGVPAANIGLASNHSFSVAAWVRYDELPEGRSNFITIEDRISGGWPYDNWGYFWSRITQDGKFVDKNIDTTWGWRTDGSQTEGGRIFYRYDDAKLEVGIWTHVVIVFDYQAGTNKMKSTFYINGKKQDVSVWCAGHKGTIEGYINQRAGGDWSKLEILKGLISPYGEYPTEPDYIAHNYGVAQKPMWICFGGRSQDISAVKGCVDDFQIWGKAMTPEDVALSMKGLDKNALPEDVYGYWDFENENGDDDSFIGYTGKNAPKTEPKAYLYDINSAGEGQNGRIYQKPQYLVGSPYISGTKYPITTSPSWETRRAEVTNASGTDTEGSATIKWAKPGDYTVTLHLTNGHGEASKDYPVVSVVDPDADGIEDVVADGDFSTYTIDDAIFVEFAADGTYDVEVYALNGTLVGKNVADVVAGQNMKISIATQGVYLVKVVRDGKLLRTVKVIRN